MKVMFQSPTGTVTAVGFCFFSFQSAAYVRVVLVA